MRKILTAIMLLGLVTPVWANTIYSYVGHNFNAIENDYALPVPGTYTTAMDVSGWFETASPLAANLSLSDVTPLSYSFTDGRSIYTQLDSVLTYTYSFEVSTDANGMIDNWFIGIQRFGTGYLWTNNDTSRICRYPAQPCVYDLGAVEPNWNSPTTQRDSAIVWDQPGTWTSTPVPVTEPATLALLGLGLAGLGFAWRKQI